MQITDPIFFDADEARAHLEALLWPDGPTCPHCGECENVHRLQGKSHRAGLVQCNSCLKNFTVTVGTVFERSKIPLNKWLLATFLLSSGKKGTSSHQLHRMLGVTYKTAWFMTHRIREAMKDNATAQKPRPRSQSASITSPSRPSCVAVTRSPTAFCLASQMTIELHSAWRT